MSVGKFLEHMKGLTPPGDNEDPRPWRLNVFWSILVIGTLLTGHLLAVHGYLESLGISATANASELNTLNVRSKAILYAIYSPQIRAKVRERCDAESATATERVNVELDRLKNEFKAAAGEKFTPLPTCAEV